MCTSDVPACATWEAFGRAAVAEPAVLPKVDETTRPSHERPIPARARSASLSSSTLAMSDKTSPLFWPVRYDSNRFRMTFLSTDDSAALRTAALSRS